MRYPRVPRDLAAIAVQMRVESDDPELPSMLRRRSRPTLRRA
jgi:hypothetical protein